MVSNTNVASDRGKNNNYRWLDNQVNITINNDNIKNDFHIYHIISLLYPLKQMFLNGYSKNV